MAKKKVGGKSSVNKTQMIRDELDKDPEASPTEIAAKLHEYGVTAQYVSTIKFNLKKKADGATSRKPGAVGRPPGRPASTGGADPAYKLSDLVRASKLAEDLGGVQKAQELLKALDKLS